MIDPKEKKTLLDPTDLTILREQETEASEEDKNFVCPDCGSDSVIIVSHCKTCLSCGWSLCSI